MGLGQFTGSRSTYVYQADGGKEYLLTLDDSLVIVGSGLVQFDPEEPGNATPAPKRFKPRGVYWQGTATGFEGKRKFLICSDPAGALYGVNVRQPITVDGIAGETTGRRGEKLSFI